MSFNFGDLIAGLRSGVFIKSVQTGTITFDAHSVASATATITSVNTNKAFPTGLAFTVVGQASGETEGINITLTNATTVTASVPGTFGSGVRTVLVNFSIVEFY